MDVDEESDYEPKRPPSPQFIPAPTTSGRQWRFPQWFQDFQPLKSAYSREDQSSCTIYRFCKAQISITTTGRNSQAWTSEYHHKAWQICVYETYPSHIPDEDQGLDDCCDAPELVTGHNEGAQQWWTRFGAKILVASKASSECLYTISQYYSLPFIELVLQWINYEVSCQAPISYWQCSSRGWLWSYTPPKI